MKNFCQLWLTCADKTEAEKITKALLEKHLVACAKQVPVSSDFLWQGKVDHNDEILLIMDSREDLFDQIEAEIARLHSYEIFVLQAIPISKISKQAEVWLKDSLNINS